MTLYYSNFLVNANFDLEKIYVIKMLKNDISNYILSEQNSYQVFLYEQNMLLYRQHNGKSSANLQTIKPPKTSSSHPHLDQHTIPQHHPLTTQNGSSIVSHVLTQQCYKYPIAGWPVWYRGN